MEKLNSPNSVCSLFNVRVFNFFARLPTTSCLNYLCKIPRLWANANGPLTSLAGYMRCSEGRREGHYYAGRRRIYIDIPWRTTVRISLFGGTGIILQQPAPDRQTDDIDKPYLRPRRGGCIKSYLSRFPICSSLTNYIVVRLEFAPEIEVLFVFSPIEYWFADTASFLNLKSPF